MKKQVAQQVGVAVICLLASACAASPIGSVHTVKDNKGLALNLSRLSIAVTDLNAVVDPENAHANGAARSSGCTVDSGETFEPGAGRDWSLTGAARDNTDPTSVDARPLEMTSAGQVALENIASQLIKRGWSGTPRVKRRGGAYVLGLKRTYADHTVYLGFQGFSDSILASASTTPGHVCNH